ncbi:hypothetical protein EMPS_01091 [Entomortierella parvispora]|uniref:Uncharacterized protein n=1 Tax=Entomortierella parvispora TaxID=205924 RepID=A0A9P3H274_9FUNG|nr:hypothetical protein EMPS_01091 [Entomortierella parvispora]
MTSANPQDRVSSNPTSPNATLSSTENSAFFAEPVFSKPKLPASPTLETAMLDIKTSLPKETESPLKSASEELAESKMASPSAPLSPVAASASSPLATPAIEMSIETTIMDDSHDTDTEVTEAMEGQIQQQMETAASTPMDAEYLILDAPTGNGTGLIKIPPKSHEQQMEELEQNNQILRASLDKVLQDKERVDRDLYHTTAAYHELNGRFAELQQKLANRERDYEIMSKNYLEHVRTIRPTDDDHGTIMDKLTQLKASIEHLIRKTQGGRSVNLNKAAAIEYLKGAGLLENFPIEEDRLEPYHLNLFMESVVMSTLIQAFFGKHLSCVFEHNQSFKDIYEWMVARDDKLAIRWRQHLCVLLAKDPKTKALQEEVVEKTAKALSDDLTKVYTNANELAKSRDLCTKAFELSRAMSGMENVIYPQTVELGTQFDEETMAPSLKSNPEGKVALVVFPAFKDNQDAFDVRPKVWCY